MATPDSEVYDLLLLVDATASMGTYLESLQSSLPQIISVSALTGCFSRIGLLAYRDYTDEYDPVNGLLDWSGWLDPQGSSPSITAEELMAKVRNLEAHGGGDYPEATKTGLAKAYEVMREDATTIILLYTDAPPQTAMTGRTISGSNHLREQTALKCQDSYGSTGHLFADWVNSANTLRSGSKKAQVFSFLEPRLGNFKASSGYYSYLSTMSRGCCLYLSKSVPATISETTIDVLLAWMGMDKESLDSSAATARLVRYKDGDGIESIKDEKDPTAQKFFWSGNGQKNAQDEGSDQAELYIHDNIATVDVTQTALKQYLPKIETPLIDFSQRYVNDDTYKALVVAQLRKLIDSDVYAISLNPVFGKLWRAVCNDRQNPARDDLVQAFGSAVERISNKMEKARMREWLEDSFDYAADILHTIEQVPQDDRFPCVFLDPTLEFSAAQQQTPHTLDDENDSSSTFQRAELLEIARSCDPRVLRRLGRVLTRLTYVESAADLPTHIAATTDDAVPKIPVALASQQHQWKFWKILLHLVVPGTMLASRPAVLLAALTLRLGIKPLFEPASAAMLFWSDKWNDNSITENWNVSCLALLIDADDAYRARRTSKQTGDNSPGEPEGLLKREDRNLFDTLVSYKLAEANMQTTLTARVPWTPHRTSMPIGPLAVCKSCRYPRSITMMSEAQVGKCGLCASNFPSEEDREAYIHHRVSQDDNESIPATWVECNVRTCRAQYVVYNIEQLNVRSKCFDCRHASTMSAEERERKSPHWLECTKCLNRVIWPKAYRTGDMKHFTCVACSNGRQTIVNVTTSVEKLCKENGLDWLLLNRNGKLPEPFNGRSLFHTITTTDPTRLATDLTILPALDSDGPRLTLKGKPIQNLPALRSELNGWITRRAVQASPCSLCFTDAPTAALRPACARSGCAQRVCAPCLRAWYGLNAPGRLLNPAALFCPFCRRAPSARTLAAYGLGVHALRDLGPAVAERGAWVHAWCRICASAVRYLERSCARGAPPAVEDFVCAGCITIAREQAEREEAEALRVLDQAATMATEEREAAIEAVRRAGQRRRGLLIEPEPKPCPGCGAPSVKTEGCDHVVCAVPTCGVHWCWRCGGAFDEEEIYDHMAMEHGGLYGDDYDDY